METIIGLMIIVAILAVVIWVGCLPIIIAQNKKSSSCFAIGFLAVLGWFIFPLWLVAVVWAISEKDKSATA